MRFNQTLETYLQVSVNNNAYNLAKYNKINITDTTEKRNPKTGQSSLQIWILKCVNKNYNAKINTFLESTLSSSPTSETGATTITPIGWSFNVRRIKWK